MNSVFVYADGQIGLMALPVDIEPSNWRRVIRSGRVSAFRDPPVMITAKTEEFDLRGHMFDGRPIYCAPGFEVTVASQEMSIRERDSARALEELHRTVGRFVQEEYPDAIELDRWEGDAPVTGQEVVEKERWHLARKCVRVLVAVRGKVPSYLDRDGRR